MNEPLNTQVTLGDAKLAAPRKPYRQPVLTEYGHVAALTQNASCAGSNDSATTLTCDPSTLRQMNSASDRTLKMNTMLIDTHPLGFGLYLFDYKPEYRDEWGHGRQFGVMADEVEPILPKAVAVHEAGYKLVDYAMLGIRQSRY